MRLAWPSQQAKRDQLLGLALVFIAGLAAILVAGTQGFRVPDVDVASATRSIVAWISGLFVLAGGGVVVVQAVRRLRAGLAVVGALLILVGLMLVGVTVGVPRALEPILGLLQALVDLLNLLLELAGKMA